MTTPAGVTLSIHGAEESEPFVEEIIDLYTAAHDSGGFHSREKEAERLSRYRSAPGFTLVAAHDDNGDMIGFCYGYVLPPNPRWWSHVRPLLPDEFIREDENGSRTFAVNDIVVRPDWQRKGLARAMHEMVLSQYLEHRFTLLVDHDNEPARLAYEKWGYRFIGKQQPFPDSPVYDTMILERV